MRVLWRESSINWVSNTHDFLVTALLSNIDAWPAIAFCLFGLGPVCVLSHVWLLVTPWTVSHQAPLSVEFSGQEYWSRLPFPTLGIFLTDLASPVSPALMGRFLPLKPPGETLGLGRGCQTFFVSLNVIIELSTCLPASLSWLSFFLFLLWVLLIQQSTSYWELKSSILKPL